MQAPLPEDSNTPFASFTRVAPYYDELMRDVPYGSWVQYVFTLADRFQLEPRRILDLACGTGTISLMLEERGYEVVGIDGSAAMLAQARRKAAAVRRSIPFLEYDLRSFKAPGEFDLVLCLYDSLNNILEPEGVQDVCRCVRRALRPGGLFILDVNTEYALRANLFSQEYMSPKAPVQYRWKSRYDYGSRICTVDMEFWVIENGTRQHFQEVHQQRAYGQPELQRFLQTAGLEPLAAFDGPSLRQPRPQTDRMYMVARRLGPDEEAEVEHQGGVALDR